MRKATGGTITIVCAASLAACVPAPRVDIVKTGALPPAASSFSLVEGADTPARAMLAGCLAGHGIAAAADPAYLVQVSEAERPKKVGALVRQPDGAPVAAKARPQWLPGAIPDRRWVRSLAVSLIRASTGQEVYRIVVSERYSPRSKRARTDLAKAACDGLANPA